MAGERQCALYLQKKMDLSLALQIRIIIATFTIEMITISESPKWHLHPTEKGSFTWFFKLELKTILSVDNSVVLIQPSWS